MLESRVLSNTITIFKAIGHAPNKKQILTMLSTFGRLLNYGYTDS